MAGIDVSQALTEKMGPFPTWLWLTALTGAGLGWYLWERHEAASSSSSSSSSTGSSPTEPTTGSQSTVEGTQYIPDYVFQNYNEIPQQAPPTVNVSSTTPVTVNNPAPTSSPAAQATQYKAPTGLTATKTASGTAKITWNLAGQPSPAPTSYTVALYQMNGVSASTQTVSVPDTPNGTGTATVSGLHPGWEYQVHVWANGGKVAPPHASTTVKV